MGMVSGSEQGVGIHAPWARWLAGAGLVTLVFGLVAAGCALSRTGTLTETCTADSECEDGNPCTEGTCSADGFCSYSSVPDGDRPAQTTHDCRTERCLGGEPETVDTPTDKPVDEPCLTYDCEDLVLESDELTNDEPCELNGVPGT
ncbi:MAG: hypothetical protein JRI68_20970, partial [Deltaproteobacteria bacterium]|nr:hypothetical protein [Deltaproteobacteria bacterium]